MSYNFEKEHELGSGNFWWRKETPEEVRIYLSECHANQYPVRVWYADDSGRSWGDEWDVLGRIGRSTGTKPIPLLVTFPPIGDGYGGMHMLDHRVVRIDAFINKNMNMFWSTLYEHDDFSLPDYVVDWEPGDTMVKVLADKTLVASFKTHIAAYAYICFMTGITHEQGYLGLETDGD